MSTSEMSTGEMSAGASTGEVAAGAVVRGRTASVLRGPRSLSTRLLRSELRLVLRAAPQPGAARRARLRARAHRHRDPPERGQRRARTWR